MAEWTQAWWQWAQSLPEIPSNNSGPHPVYENPLYDNDGSLAYLGDAGPVFFLGGVYRLTTDPANPAPVVRTRSVVIPTGTPIFFPVLNALTSAGRADRPQDDAGLITRTNGSMGLITEAHASLNGLASGCAAARNGSIGASSTSACGHRLGSASK